MKQLWIIISLIVLASTQLRGQTKSDFPIGIWELKSVECNEKEKKYLSFFDSCSIELKEDSSVRIIFNHSEIITDENIIQLSILFKNATWSKFYFGELRVYVIYSDSEKSIAQLHDSSSDELDLSFSFDSPKAFWDYELVFEK